MMSAWALTLSQTQSTIIFLNLDYIIEGVCGKKP